MCIKICFSSRWSLGFTLQYSSKSKANPWSCHSDNISYRRRNLCFQVNLSQLKPLAIYRNSFLLFYDVIISRFLSLIKICKIFSVTNAWHTENEIRSSFKFKSTVKPAVILLRCLRFISALFFRQRLILLEIVISKTCFISRCFSWNHDRNSLHVYLLCEH